MPPTALTRSAPALLATALLAVIARAEPPSNAPTTAQADWSVAYSKLEARCVECHGGKKEKGGINLKRLEKDPAVLQEYELWTRVQQAVSSGDMPPDDAKALTASEKKALLDWVDHSLDTVARANAGDPGPVILRRLTNSEYDNAIRDLTGLPFNFAREFVPDGGGGEGFSNVGDTLFVSPQQLDKYFAAARELSEHATILPGTGVRFRSQRLGVRGPAQVKSDAESAMFFWYQKVAMDHLPKDGEDLRFGEYMLACWKWKHRESTGAYSLAALAKESGLSPAFLQNWWNFLSTEEPKSRFLDLTRGPWKELPPPDPMAPKETPKAVAEKVESIQTQLRAWYLPEKWSVLRAQQDSDELKTYSFDTQIQGQSKVHLVLGDLGDGNRGDIVLVTALDFFRNGKKENYLEWLQRRLKEDRSQLEKIANGADTATRAEIEARIQEAERILGMLGKHPKGLPVDANTLVMEAPTVLTLPLPEGTTRFLAPAKLDVKGPEIEFASAQWKAYADAPPDPHGILPGVITVWKRGTETQKKVSGDFWPLHEMFAMNLEHRLNSVAGNRYRSGKPGYAIYYYSDAQLSDFISGEQSDYLKAMHEDWRFVWNKIVPKNLEPEWDKKVLSHLEAFAAKAWRRPLAEAERQQLAAVYQNGLAAELDRESAAREVLVRTLVAPAFLFKLEQGTQPGIHPLGPYELASRLSFFLWSSIPDTRLLERAADGSITKPEVLKEETLRMLRDPRASALGREFAAQWFQFQGFDSYGKVDGGKFPEFTPELRKDFNEEINAFFSHIFRENRPVVEILSADYTFVNERLARHYGIPDVTGEELRRVNASGYARGGLLGMGAVLTRTSYPHRTSPVLRGNWILRTILGTPTPPPPNDVPKLDDSVAAAKSLRERLERHRADRACSGCHDKIDPLGFALEGFDPIGRRRDKDDAGATVDDRAKTKEGREFSGMTGLREVLVAREGEFSSLFCRKLVGYALGRTVLPTDKLLLETMRTNLQSGDPSVAGAILAVVQSKQFQNRRGE